MNLRDSIKNVLDILRTRYVLNETLPSFKTLADGCKVTAYRGDHGNSCAIGCLLDDSVYHKKFEELDILTILDRFPYIVESLQSKGLYPTEPTEFSRMSEFLVEIQLWHDLWLVTHFTDRNRVEQSLSELEIKWELKCRQL